MDPTRTGRLAAEDHAVPHLAKDLIHPRDELAGVAICASSISSAISCPNENRIDNPGQFFGAQPSGFARG